MFGFGPDSTVWTSFMEQKSQQIEPGFKNHNKPSSFYGIPFRVKQVFVCISFNFPRRISCLQYVVFPSEFFDHPLSQMRLKAEYYLEKSQCRLDAPLSPLTEGGLTFFLFFLQQQCFSKLLCVTRGSKTSL